MTNRFAPSRCCCTQVTDPCYCRCCNKDITLSVLKPFTLNGPYYNPVSYNGGFDSGTGPNNGPYPKYALQPYNQTSDIILNQYVPLCGPYDTSSLGTLIGTNKYSIFTGTPPYEGFSNAGRFMEITSSCVPLYCYYNSTETSNINISISDQNYFTSSKTHPTSFVQTRGIAYNSWIAKSPSIYLVTYNNAAFPLIFTKTLLWSAPKTTCYIFSTLSLEHKLYGQTGGELISVNQQQALDYAFTPVEIVSKDCCITYNLSESSTLINSKYNISWTQLTAPPYLVLSDNGGSAFYGINSTSDLGRYGDIGPTTAFSSTQVNTCG